MTAPTSPDASDSKRLLTATRRQLAATGGPDFLPALATDLFARTPPEDLAVYTAAEITAYVRAAGELLLARQPRRHLIRIENPEVKGDGHHAEITLVETLTDNMPFLLDSIIGEIEDFGGEIRLVAHPVVSVVRDRSGRISEYRGLTAPAEGSSAIRESLIQIHIARLAGDEARQALAERLDSLLGAVRRAFEGWGPIRARLHDAIAAYRANPPPIDPDELAESVAFLEWLLDDNFTFLGAREYDFAGPARTGELQPRPGSGMGLLADPDVHVLRRAGQPVSITPAIRDFLMRPEALIITKANVKSRVHRRAYADYIGVKLFSERGTLTGELRIIGLFTSTAYARSTAMIPILREKAERVLKLAGHDPESYTGRHLVNVLEAYPRDELFQIDDELLFQFVHEILALEERPRVRALVRPDKFDRFVSVIVFVPRDRYDSQVRERIGKYLAEAYDGHVSAYYPSFPEAMPLTRVHFIIGRSTGPTPSPPRSEIEVEIAALTRTWADNLRFLLSAREETHGLVDRYREAFPAAYRDDFPPEAAIADIAIFETLTPEAPLHVAFRGPTGGHPEAGLKLVHLGAPIALSERVPMLENMGFRVIDERSYEVSPVHGSPIYLHDMVIEPANGVVDMAARKAALADCLLAVWYGLADNDAYNTLVLFAGLDWRQAALVRAVGHYLQQGTVAFAQAILSATLCRHAPIAALLVDLFNARFHPESADAKAAREAHAKIEAALEGVARLDEDRVIRSFLAAFGAMVRTNFFQAGPDREPHGEISFKIEPRRIDWLPEPKPFREIFVHSPAVEGVHLRFGPIARGGIRWSDRPHDFRTEILSLAKAQQVKNAVIVPVGAKGGFVPRRLPRDGREAVQQAGIAAYRTFINALLDLTDSISGEEVVAPPMVVRHDGDDPYLVVAADKGTSSFSDLANEISAHHHFWLDDAFASGGSAGYDHKAMGITARGAWEAVKRHFRELDVDIQTTPFTVTGVGDMSGDVFGNGMLQSRNIKLTAAFDHRDIFIDPSPDPEASYAERRRLFDLPRSSWQDYDRSKMSAGGGVFSRSEKAIRVTREMRALLDLATDRVTPAELIRAVLKAKVDLLWFGGIGTFVRATTETDEQVGDRANDQLRIMATEIGARIVGEGANLAMTQRARVEYSLAGGRCNTDAIDNSAGVNTSDLEVNIKIALRPALIENRIDRHRRDKLLKSMTDDVAALVLVNNYRQTLAISLTRHRGMEDFAFQRRLIRNLESAGQLDRALEALPDEAAMVERQKAGKGLMRPEIAVLLAYAKITLNGALADSDFSEDPALAEELMHYFPAPMHRQFAPDIARHRLRRQIIVTQIANDMINRGGPTFLARIADQTGAEPAQIARAFVAARAVYALDELYAAIDALDGKVPGSTQLRLYREVQGLLLSETVWFVRNADFSNGIAAVVDHFRPAVTAVEGIARKAPQLADEMARRVERLDALGVAPNVAQRIAALRIIARAPDMLLAAEASGRSLHDAAEAYLSVAHDFGIARLADLARSIAVTDYYDELALSRALQSLSNAQRRLAVAALANGGTSASHARQPAIRRVLDEVAAMTEGGPLTVSAIGVAAGLISDLAAEPAVEAAAEAAIAGAAGIR